jgi:peptide/nickel transport system permease protein
MTDHLVPADAPVPQSDPEDIAPLESTGKAFKHRSLRSDVWRQFRRHKGAVVGLVLLVLIILFSFIGPWLWGVDPQALDVAAKNQGVSWTHPFGTDNLGRDVMAQVMEGGKISLLVGLTAMLIGVFVGMTIGVLSGFFRSLDGMLMRFTDLFLALPVLPLLLVVLVLFRNPVVEQFGVYRGTFLLVVGTIGVTSWMTTARVVRGQVLAVKQKEFVLAAQSIGSRRRNIIGRHVLPNVLSPVMVAAALGVAAAIITESVLSFLGLGFPEEYPTWGQLLQKSRDFWSISPMRVFAPGALISLTVISVNLIGDGMRDALDPKLRSKS